MGFRNQTHKERERGRMEKKKSPNQTSALRGEADEDWAGLKNASTCSTAELRTVLRLAAGVRVRLLQHEKEGKGVREALLEYLKT